MVSSGAIDTRTADIARQAPVKLVKGLEIQERSGLYFKEQVRRELVERFGWQRVYQGGLRVFTTLDADMQASAEALVEKNLQDIEKRRGFKHSPRGQQPVKEGEAPDYLQGALVAIDPANGYVRAMVGGRDVVESDARKGTDLAHALSLCMIPGESVGTCTGIVPRPVGITAPNHVLSAQAPVIAAPRAR